jgi:nitrogen regulatory protein PII
MTQLHSHSNVSVVTAILPQSAANHVIEQVFAIGERNTLLINARGTLIRDRWYQALLPVMSPEKEFLQFLVPDSEVAHIVETIVIAADMHIPGTGAVFSVPCDELVCSEDFALWSDSTWEKDTFNASRNFRENLTAIYCIVSTDQTDIVSRAAMSAGAHGPVIFFCEGRGLRDRLGWLRITKKNDKEVIVVIVDNADAVSVTEAMIDAGDIDLPGHGFLFRMPVQMGVINIGSTFGQRRHAASMQQIISAIDELQGSSGWRDQRVNQLVGTGKSAGLNLFGKVKERTYLSGQTILSCIVGRKHVEDILDATLAAGAPGANVSYAKLIESQSRANTHGVRLNRERAIIRVILPETQLSAVVTSIEALCAVTDLGEICVYSQPVTRAITYVPDLVASPARKVAGLPPAT